MSNPKGGMRRPMGHGGPHGPMGGGEKARDFKGTMGKLFQYLGQYRIAILFVVLFAIGSAIFSIVGPKVLGQATTEIFNGLVSKITGEGGGIDFGKIGNILIFLLCLYAVSSLFSFIQGYIMTGVSQKVSYNLRKAISEKINRMPMKYFETRTHGEVLSRVTNDVDTLSHEPQPEHDPDHHLRYHPDRRAGDDAVHQLADDPGGAGDPAGVHGAHLALSSNTPRSISVLSRSIWDTSTARWRRYTADTTSSSAFNGEKRL